jgi:hypothetical protein
MVALWKLTREELVHGLPKIGHVEQLCEACQVEKQRHTLFPVKVEYRVRRRLELVHDDLCGPIVSATPGGNKYFLLFMDDLNKYMWVAAIASKDHAVAAIKEIQEWAEGESGLKLRALHTYREWEFIARDFMEYCATEGVHH